MGERCSGNTFYAAARATGKDRALRRDQIGDAFSAQIDSISRSSSLRKCRFLARTLHFDKRAVLRRDEIKIDRGRLVFLVIEIEQRASIKHADTDRRDKFLDRRFGDFFLPPASDTPRRRPGLRR